MQFAVLVFLAAILAVSAFMPHKAIRSPAPTRPVVSYLETTTCFYPHKIALSSLKFAVLLFYYFKSGSLAIYCQLFAPCHVSLILQSSMKIDFSKFTPAIPAAMMPFVVPAVTLAAEGTGRVSFCMPSHVHHFFNFNADCLRQLRLVIFNLSRTF